MGLGGLLGAVGVGAGFMYLLDPQGGGRRRALIRDQAFHLRRLAEDAADATRRDVRNRTHGMVAELRSRLRGDVPVNDAVLLQRVRSRIGQVIGHAGAIEVAIQDGRVTLGGPVLAHEAPRLVRRVEAVRGVRHVENRLQTFERPGDHTALQGRPHAPRGGEVFELMQQQWSPTARLLVGVAGGVLGAWGFARGGLPGTVMSLAGVSLTGRALANEWPWRLGDRRQPVRRIA